MALPFLWIPSLSAIHCANPFFTQPIFDENLMEVTGGLQDIVFKRSDVDGSIYRIRYQADLRSRGEANIA